MQARIWLDTLRDVNMLRDTSIRLFGRVIGTRQSTADKFYTAAFKDSDGGMFYPSCWKRFCRCRLARF